MTISRLLLLFSLIFVMYTKAQNTVPVFNESNLILISEDKNGLETKYTVENAYMVLVLSNGDFSLNADLSDIKTGNKSKDSLVNSNGEQTLFFKGNTGENIAAFNQHENDEKTYSMSGVLNLNGYSIACTAQFDPINLGDKSETKSYRMDFTLSVDASKIVIKGLENTFYKQIVFEIAAGKLNIQQ